MYIRKLLFDRLVPEDALPPDFLARIRRWKSGSGTFRMNVALSELPSFTALPGQEPADHHTAGIIIAPSLGYMDRAYDDAKREGWSREPIIEMLIPSTLDDSLGSEGAACGEPVLPACAAGALRWPLLGRPSRESGRSDDRDGGSAMRPASSRACSGGRSMSPLDLERHVRTDRWRHLPWRV